MEWTFFLDNIEISEPVGFADIQLKVTRDDKWHGIFFEASTSDLKFYGDAFDYLKLKHDQEGFTAEVIFKAIVLCGYEQDLFEGKLDFRQYKERCGTECFIILPVEQTGCVMTLRNRYDQKVDLDNNVAFDKLTGLEDYEGLNTVLELAAQENFAAVEGYVNEAGDEIALSIFAASNDAVIYHVRPTYGRAVNNSIQTGQLDPAVFAASTNGVNDSALSPQLLMEDTIACFDGDFEYTVRMKGSFDINLEDICQNPTASAFILVGYVPAGGDQFNDAIYPHAQVLGPCIDADNVSGMFDYTFTGTLPLAEGDQFLAIISFGTGAGGPHQPFGQITFDPETYIKISANKSCPVTTARVSFIHETAARVVEAITDKCLTVKSEYYGRTDSEPYSFSSDGCGGLRVLSSGLRIRKAVVDKHFLSLKELYEGLTGIDNLGMGLETNVLRIEPVEFFYQDQQLLKHPLIPLADRQTQADLAYSIVKIGYKKWEIESASGLDEFNSNKEFRTSLKSINNTLDQTSGFIAGGYAIEHTREQSFADTGAADTKYDNDTFIVCVRRAAYAYGNFEVEQGNIDNASGMFSPATAYNWRIRPMYNLMRWWKSVAQSYVVLVNTASKLFFSSGTGNLLAKGELIDPYGCKVDANNKSESDDLHQSDMITGQDPIWRSETLDYRYPMSLREYNLVKAAPYGYIYAQCGDGEFVKGFIKSIVYKVAKGEADITLKLKWGT